jgi:hypothetical protein
MTSDQQVRPRRHTRIWLALSVILVLIALLVVPPLISIARYKNRITALVSAALRRPVRLSSVELRILPRPGFVLTDLTVEEDPSYGAEPILHAGTVTTAIRLSSLWRGQLQLSRISVDEASLNLVHTPDGRWNIDPLFHTAATLPGPAGGRAVPYPYMEATNSRINIKNGVEKLPYSLVSTDASLWQDSGVWHVRLKAQPARTDVVLDLADTGILRVEATLHPGPGLEQMPLHVDIDWNEAQFGQLTRLILGSDEGWRGDLRGEFHLDGTAASAQVKSRLRATGLHRAEFAPVTPLDFDATCSFAFQSSSRALQNLLCDSPIGPGRARLTGDIPGSRAAPGQSPHLALEIDHVPAQAGLDVLRTLRTNVAPGLQATGSVSGKMTYDPALAAASQPEPGAHPQSEVPHPRRVFVFAPRVGRGRRPAGPPRPPAGPLSGGFVFEGLRLTGDTLTNPVQIAKLTLDPALQVPGQPVSLTATFPIPAGGPTPLTLTARLALHHFLLTVRGTAALPRLRELVHVAGIPQAENLSEIAGEPAALDLKVEGPWLPEISSLPSGPGAPATLVPASSTAGEGRMTGAITFHDANWKPAFLALPVQLRTATLRFENGALRWDAVEFSYGPVQGSAFLSLPPTTCEPPEPCLPHLTLEFDSLDAGTVQSAILGARESGTLLSTLLARLKPNSTPAWPPLEGRLQIATLDLEPFTLNNISADFRVQAAGAEITSLDAGTLGGKVHLAASLTPGEKPDYKLSGSFEKLNPAPVLQLLGMKGSGGPIDGTGHIELSGYSDKDLSASAKGDLHFDWKRGVVAGLTDDPIPPALDRFDRFTSDATIANGAMTLGKNQVQRGQRKSAIEAKATFAIPAQVEFGPAPDQHSARR